MPRSSSLAARALVPATLFAACLPPSAAIAPPDYASLGHGDGQSVRLPSGTVITAQTSLTVGRWSASSIAIPARVMVIGEEGLCFPARFFGQRPKEPTKIRIHGISAQLAARVIPDGRKQGVEVRRSPAGDIEGRAFNSYSIMLWIDEHVRRYEDAKRAYVDLPTPRYEQFYDREWHTLDVGYFRESALAGGLEQEPTATTPAPPHDLEAPVELFGWAWTDIERLELAAWPASADPGSLGASLGASPVTSYLPTVCPIRGTPRPLLGTAPS